MWQPIETAPKDNKRPLWLARFNDDGTMQSFDYNGSWESESESWEMPQVYYFWATDTLRSRRTGHTSRKSSTPFLAQREKRK